MTWTFGDPRLPRRFWDKAEIAANGCWRWTGSLTEGGYGKIWNATEKKPVRAHRWVYEALRGPIASAFVDHVCHNQDLGCRGGQQCLHRRCVNPAHLEPTTNRLNILSGRTFAARHAAQTRCIHGHEFTASNTYICSRGTRVCRTCRSTWARERREARKNCVDGLPVVHLPMHQDSPRGTPA